MKSQRRHALQENQLAKVIVGAPSYWQQFGGRGLLAAIAILAIALLIRYRINASRTNLARATAAVANVREQIRQLENLSLSNLPPEPLAKERSRILGDASSLIEEVSRLQVEKSLLAENLIAKGDLNLTAYNLPQIPGAATQPSLKLSSDPKELLTTATDAYQTVLDRYPDQRNAVMAARFGLATIDENRNDWDAAKRSTRRLRRFRISRRRIWIRRSIVWTSLRSFASRYSLPSQRRCRRQACPHRQRCRLALRRRETPLRWR